MLSVTLGYEAPVLTIIATVTGRGKNQHRNKPNTGKFYVRKRSQFDITLLPSVLELGLSLNPPYPEELPFLGPFLVIMGVALNQNKTKQETRKQLKSKSKHRVEAEIRYFFFFFFCRITPPPPPPKHYVYKGKVSC